MPSISGYYYSESTCGCAHRYLLPAIERALVHVKISPCRAFDLGCGNGSVANWLTQKGFTVSGVDPSETGISVAKAVYPHLALHVGSAYDPLQESFGTFPLIYNLLDPGGYALVSTPYHGYFKNIALALSGRMDKHFTALWDHGHIKFWSRKTLSQLFSEAGLAVLRIDRIGRVPDLAKTMLAIVQKVT